MVGKAWQQEHGAAGDLMSVQKTGRRMLALNSLFSFYSGWGPSHGMVPPTLKVGLSAQLK